MPPPLSFSAHGSADAPSAHAEAYETSWSPLPACQESLSVAMQVCCFSVALGEGTSRHPEKGYLKPPVLWPGHLSPCWARCSLLLLLHFLRRGSLLPPWAGANSNLHAASDGLKADRRGKVGWVLGCAVAGALPRKVFRCSAMPFPSLGPLRTGLRSYCRPVLSSCQSFWHADASNQDVAQVFSASDCCRAVTSTTMPRRGTSGGAIPRQQADCRISPLAHVEQQSFWPSVGIASHGQVWAMQDSVTLNAQAFREFSKASLRSRLCRSWFAKPTP